MFIAREGLSHLNIYKIIFRLILIGLLIFLILRFLVNNFFLFYGFFEISLIPTFLLIIG